ncbi:MAG: serine hydrolase domain-containing protein [Pseudomonadota bacterium]
MKRVSNPDLTVGPGNKPRWNQPAHRRQGFHNAHLIFRRTATFRAKRVLQLGRATDSELVQHPAVLELGKRPEFSGLCLMRYNEILVHEQAADFPGHQPHSIQSISKLFAHLIAGRLIASGQLNPEDPVEHYLPEIGTGYRGARVADVLDMNVANDFSEDYHDPHADSYAEEAALGWRLSAEGTPEPRLHDFICAITSDGVANASPKIRYSSANTDLMTLIFERLAPGCALSFLEELVEEAGFEHALHMSLSVEGIPALCGGGCLSLSDLGRFGLMLNCVARDAARPWQAAYLRRTMERAHKTLPEPRAYVRYAGQMMSDGRWVGHTGYGGQVLMTDPESGTVCAYLSVLENEAGYCVDYMARTMDLMAQLLDMVRSSA